MEVAVGTEGSLVVPVREASQVSDARRKALALALALGLADETKANLALVLSEAASNLVKHAREGVCLLRGLARPDGASAERGIELLFLDRGPGMGNVAACMADGFSTAGSMGTGFGAMRRLATRFDVHSIPGLGTALVLELWDPPPRAVAPAEERRRLVLGAVSAAKPGEWACGDGWAFAGRNLQGVLLVVDGLGHGEAAAQVSQRAIARFLRARESDPARVLAELDEELHGTRGAAAAVLTIDAQRGLVRHCGVGNTAGGLFHADGVQRLVSPGGTLGLGVRRAQVFEYRWTKATTLVLHTDGLSTRWELERYPGLARRHPSLLAGVLYRDFARGNDDATVVVAREGA